MSIYQIEMTEGSSMLASSSLLFLFSLLIFIPVQTNSAKVRILSVENVNISNRNDRGIFNACLVVAAFS